ncbi:hypothetical protein BAE44_0022453 [Dichanthelium oligosanthes]|uniref:F-box protein AT5G49610-like beta-propeller domain-containing protein n=1 Tax=Dichanthelium oligosanthes TaxID=888268 RepID=A0A1E5UUN8_9POAL|nr:hypothetical protein BAE44_0022453 [Dichanthelium oligosanthes]
MLGFLCDFRGEDDDEEETAISHFVSTSSFLPRPLGYRSRSGWRAVDSRHGRVLLHALPYRFAPFDNVLTVWNPITGEELNLPRLPRDSVGWSAAVLCAAAACDHHPDCHRGPFRVVFVGTDNDRVFSCVYSSVDGAWSEPAFAVHPHAPQCLDSVPGVLVGNALYFRFQLSARILRYDLGAGEVSVIERPPTCADRFRGRAVLVSMEDGRLGFAAVHEARLSLWSREVASDGESRWTQSRVIELGTMLPAHSLWSFPDLIGFADGVGVFFLWTVAGGLHLVNLQTGLLRRFRTELDIYGVVPYVSYYIPALRIAAEDDGDRQGHHSVQLKFPIPTLSLSCFAFHRWFMETGDYVGFAHGIGFFFVETQDGWLSFTIDNSGQELGAL